METVTSIKLDSEPVHKTYDILKKEKSHFHKKWKLKATYHRNKIIGWHNRFVKIQSRKYYPIKDGRLKMLLSEVWSMIKLWDKLFLPMLQKRSTASHTKITRVFNEAVQNLWSDGLTFDNVFVLVGDAAVYATNTEERLSVTYPKLLRVTRIVQTLCTVDKTISVLHPNIDKLVANGGKIFVKPSVTIELHKKKPPAHYSRNTSNYTLGNLVGCHYVLCRKLRNILLCGKRDRDDTCSFVILQQIFNGSNESYVLKSVFA
jgi:hypothetical protein